MKHYRLLAFGEPLTEVLLESRPDQNILCNPKDLGRLLRSRPVHAASGDALNFLGNYAVVKRLLSQPLHLETETVGLITHTGDDRFGRSLRKTVQELRGPGIHVDSSLFILEKNGKSGLYGVFVTDASGQYEFYFDRFGYAFERMLTGKTLPQFINLGCMSEYFYTSGIAYLMTREYYLFEPLFESLRKKGVRIVFDTNFRQAVAEHARIPNLAKAFDALLSSVDILLAGASDIQSIYPEFRDMDIRKLAIQWFSRCKRFLPLESVILKCSDAGTYYWKNGLRHLPAIPCPLNACESGRLHPEGAGDAFNAGFMLATCHKKSHLEAIRFGSLSASLMVRVAGCFRGDLPFAPYTDLLIRTW